MSKISNTEKTIIPLHSLGALTKIMQDLSDNDILFGSAGRKSVWSAKIAPEKIFEAPIFAGDLLEKWFCCSRPVFSRLQCPIALTIAISIIKFKLRQKYQFSI